MAYLSLTDLGLVVLLSPTFPTALRGALGLYVRPQLPPILAEWMGAVHGSEPV